MERVLLFAGTMEGRILAEYLNENQIASYVCVATSYGEKLLPIGKWIQTSAARLAEEEIEALIVQNNFRLVIDATHPFAVAVTENIRKACAKKKIEYIRVIRKQEDFQNEKSGVWVKNFEEAVDFLQHTRGNIFLTTGSKELGIFTKLSGYKKRCYARVLSTTTVVEECEKLGFTGKNLICMQGPFSKELNLAMLKQINAAYLVTKESGNAGGFKEKIVAADQAGVIPVIIGRPEQVKGYSIKETKQLILDRYKTNEINTGQRKEPVRKDAKSAETRTITLLGIGMGNIALLTKEAEESLKASQIVIGARRVIESIKELVRETLITTDNEEIALFIESKTEYQNIVVAFSGDIGFYSGAKRLRPYLMNYRVKTISGIASPTYFLNKIGISWDDAKLLSLHGRNCNLVQEVQENEKVFVLLGGDKSISEICDELTQNHMENIQIIVGENLSYPNEKITYGTPVTLRGQEFDRLAVILLIKIII